MIIESPENLRDGLDRVQEQLQQENQQLTETQQALQQQLATLQQTETALREQSERNELLLQQARLRLDIAL